MMQKQGAAPAHRAERMKGDLCLMKKNYASVIAVDREVC